MNHHLQNQHANLQRFKDAKRAINSMFCELTSHLEDCNQFVAQHFPSHDVTASVSSHSAALNDNTDARFAALCRESFEESKDHQLEEETQYDVIKANTECPKDVTMSGVGFLTRFLTKANNIKRAIARDHMKCAFFGRTSSGKSTVINALLRNALLPSGIGHTTSCFLQIQGSAASTAHIEYEEQVDAQDPCHRVLRSQPIDSVTKLSHSLSDVKLPTNSIIKVFWPTNQKCPLLREDVVLLDSPGVDIDADMDAWIEAHCLDADVFVLVANAESTLMRVEKNFFQKVRERLSTPHLNNMFIVNNRWDAADVLEDRVEHQSDEHHNNEQRMTSQPCGGRFDVSRVRQQHQRVCAQFLTQELHTCVTLHQSRERVFFVSAKEALLSRTKQQQQPIKSVANQTEATQQNSAALPPPNQIASSATTTAAAAGMSEGWQLRLMEFAQFEAQFEKALSESAIHTKFSQHADQGRAILTHLKMWTHRLIRITQREEKVVQRSLEMLANQTATLRRSADQLVREIDEQLDAVRLLVVDEVAAAVHEQIRSLPAILDAFNPASPPSCCVDEMNDAIEPTDAAIIDEEGRVFAVCRFDPRDAEQLMLYKRHLNAYVQHALDCKMNAACGAELRHRLTLAKTEITQRYREMLTQLVHPAVSTIFDEKIVQHLRAGVPLEDSPTHTAYTYAQTHTHTHPALRIDCSRMFDNFQENVEFQFSLSPRALLTSLLAANQSAHIAECEEPRAHTAAQNNSQSAVANHSSSSAGQSQLEQWLRVAPMLGMLASHQSAAALFLLAGSLRLLLIGSPTAADGLGRVGGVSGGRRLSLVALLACAYAGVYAYERASWTRVAQERAFKRQFAGFVGERLRLVLDMASQRAAHYVHQELLEAKHAVHAHLHHALSLAERQRCELQSDAARLALIFAAVKKLRNQQIYLDGLFGQFQENFIGQ